MPQSCIKILPNSTSDNTLAGATLCLRTGQRVEQISSIQTYAGVVGDGSDFTLPINIPKHLAGNYDLIEQLKACKGSKESLSAIYFDCGIPIFKATKIRYAGEEGDGASIQLIGNPLSWQERLNGLSFCDCIDYPLIEFTEQNYQQQIQLFAEDDILYNFHRILYGDRLFDWVGFYLLNNLERVFEKIGFKFIKKGAEATSHPVCNLYIHHDVNKLQPVQGTCINPVETYEVNQAESDTANRNACTDDDVIQSGVIIQDEIDAGDQNCYLAEACVEYEVDNPFQALDADPITFNQNPPNDPNGLFQFVNVTNGVGVQQLANTIVANSEGKYRFTINVKLRAFCGGALIPGLPPFIVYDYIFHEQTFTVEEYLRCDKAVPFFFTANINTSTTDANKFIALSVCGNEIDLYRGLLDTCQSDSPNFQLTPIRLGIKICVLVEKIEEHHTCTGGTFDLNDERNCFDKNILETIKHLQENGFLFLTNPSTNEVCMIHRKDAYRNDAEARNNAEDWTNRQDCASTKESQISDQYRQLLCAGYKNDDDRFIDNYSQRFRGQDEITELGRACFDMDNPDLNTGETELVPSNPYSATPMIQAGVYNVPAMGDEPFDDVGCRLLVWGGSRSVPVREIVNGQTVATTDIYGYAYFYDEDRDFQLDYSNTHGAGLLDRWFSRYLEILKCGVEVEALIYLTACDYENVDYLTWKILRGKDGNLHYHLLTELNYVGGIGGRGLVAAKFWRVPVIE